MKKQKTPSAYPDKGSEIENGEILLRYIYPEKVPELSDGIIDSQIFSDKNLSCDWEKYVEKDKISPQISMGKTLIARITVCQEIKDGKRPNDQNGWPQSVTYEPVEENNVIGTLENLAHAEINGRKKPQVRDIIKENAEFYNY
ncbi:hypothetical protein GC194_10380 [bacterium]|nr:hypothetical protein [bacterium]